MEVQRRFVATVAPCAAGQACGSRMPLDVLRFDNATTEMAAHAPTIADGPNQAGGRNRTDVFCGFSIANMAPGDVERARELIAQEESGEKLDLLERVFTQRVLFAEAQQGQPLDIEVQVIAIGDQIAWVALPGEVFVEIGLTIKQRSPFPVTIIDELAYDWIR